MKYPLWKPVLIVVVLVGAALLLYPPSTRLKPGLDLAGGTTLIYNVRVPENANASQVIDDTIAVLRDRVDPTGTRNLVWRQVAGNRIEIQMALATAETAERRRAYLEARDRLLEQNVVRRELDAALRAEPEQRREALAQLAAGNPAMQRELDRLVEAFDALVAATGPYQQAQQEFRDAQATLRDLPDDAGEAQREEVREHVRTLQERMLDATRTYLEAKRAFEAAQQRVLADNIRADELERVLNLPAKPRAEAPSERAEALAALKAEHPERAAEIDTVAEAYAAYEKVKGPLDDPNDLIALLRGSGVLEFRIAADPANPAVDVAGYRESLREQGPRAGADAPYRWFAVRDLENFIGDADMLRALEAGELSFAQIAANRGMVGERYSGEYYILLANTPDQAITRAQENWELTSARRSQDELGQNAVAFQLNTAGGNLMNQITGPNVGRPMAILLDGRVISAPTLNSQIGSQGIITGGRGGFSEQELSFLLRTLKAGSLEGQLGDYPISIKTTGPQLGQDNLRAGLRAAILSLIVVAGFIAAYYLFAGLVADFALLANMVLILGIMATIEATFTLPGIAGIVLTIGMAVDANVLIFERIREELERKADLTTAVRLGYEKALSTVLDANITTLITCIVLGYTASAEVKGFAVTLGVGILATLFTALFCTRVILEMYVAYRTRAKTLAMIPTLVPAVRKLLSPNVNWIGMRYVFFTISAVLMVGGLSMVYARGGDMLDIEFRSGTQVSFDLAEGKTLPIGEVRQRLATYSEAGAAAQRGADPASLPEAQRQAYREVAPLVEEARERLDQARAEYEQALEQQIDVGEPPQEVLDLALLEDASVVTVGAAENGEASGFTVSTLITDAQLVSGVVKAAMADVLDTTRPINAPALEIDRVAQAPAYPITRVNDAGEAVLGQNINRPDVTEDVTPYLGGVAIVLEDMNPAVTIEELERRVQRMRQQPAYEQLGYRETAVIGLDLAGTSGRGVPRYSSAVIVSRDNQTNYVETPTAFTDAGGLADTEWTLVRDALQRDTSLASVSNFSSQVSGTMKQQAISALGLSLLAVVVYIWFRFGSLAYGLAAIVALVHDVAITLGLVAVSGWLYDNAIAHFLLLDPFKIDLAMVAACLTIVGYSLNDTIVVFDRIRENRGRLSYATPAIINDSINQTISRTVLTSGTTLLAIAILYAFGGPGVHGFAFAMLVGVGVGTYSSIAVAAPLLLVTGGNKPRPEAGPPARDETELPAAAAAG